MTDAFEGGRYGSPLGSHNEAVRTAVQPRPSAVTLLSLSNRRIYGYLARVWQPAPSHGAPGEEQAARGWQRRASRVGALLSAGAHHGRTTTK